MRTFSSRPGSSWFRRGQMRFVVSLNSQCPRLTTCGGAVREKVLPPGKGNGRARDSSHGLRSSSAAPPAENPCDRRHRPPGKASPAEASSRKCFARLQLVTGSVADRPGVCEALNCIELHMCAAFGRHIFLSFPGVQVSQDGLSCSKGVFSRIRWRCIGDKMILQGGSSDV